MAALPSALADALADVLAAAGDRSAIEQTRPLGGGCINNALRLQTSQQTYLLKWNSSPLPDMFLVEARGLEALAATNTVRVPAVIAASNATDAHPAYLLLEWLEGSQRPSAAAAQAALGTQLAALHRASADAYGFDHDNYIGSTPQYNGWQADWIGFFRERRLRPQIELAARNGQLSASRRQRCERLLTHLDEWLADVPRQPALLHGDLWSGNVIAGPGDAPALIDPAVYYGDREAEIAYTELFGGFSSDFYRAYDQAWPLAPAYEERRSLYNLYHLLNHLNLFGESYGMQVDAVLRRYVG
jgi:fructosamine-3-kinase